jgi:hypothetical protein
MAEQFTGTSGPGRPDRRCSSRAASSLPLPEGPDTRTQRRDRATRAISPSTEAMGSLPSVRIPWVVSGGNTHPRCPHLGSASSGIYRESMYGRMITFLVVMVKG